MGRTRMRCDRGNTAGCRWRMDGWMGGWMDGCGCAGREHEKIQSASSCCRSQPLAVLLPSPQEEDRLIFPATSQQILEKIRCWMWAVGDENYTTNYPLIIIWIVHRGWIRQQSDNMIWYVDDYSFLVCLEKNHGRTSNQDVRSVLSDHTLFFLYILS